MIQAGTCKHFNGIQHEACRVGVVYRDGGGTLRNSDNPLCVLPCLDASKGECSLREEPTAEEIAAHEAEIAEMLELRRQGLSSCCRAALTPLSEGCSARHCTACGKLVGFWCSPKVA
jgi:hypothetical protein